MEWCSESIGLGAKMPVDFRGPGILPQVWCGHQKWCFCAGVCSQHYEQLVTEVVLVLLLTVSPAFWWCSFLCFSKMEVMRLAFESCVLRSVDRRTQCNLQPESQASIALDFLKWTGLLWKWVMVYLGPATFSSSWMAKIVIANQVLSFGT